MELKPIPPEARLVNAEWTCYKCKKLFPPGKVLVHFEVYLDEEGRRTARVAYFTCLNGCKEK